MKPKKAAISKISGNRSRNAYVKRLTSCVMSYGDSYPRENKVEEEMN